MELLKTPHQMLLQEAGATPEPDGLLNTPEQMLMQESGVSPHFSSGGTSPQDMLAMLMAHGHAPQHLATGGGVLGTDYKPEYNPEATFEPQPDRNTYSAKARDKFADLLARLSGNEHWSEKSTNEIFGTGSAVNTPWNLQNAPQKVAQMGVQFANPVTAATGIMDAPEQAFKEAWEGNPITATATIGLAGLGALPYIGPVTKRAKHLLNTIPKKIK